jgi:Holliday junction resolvasome RuvABC ATP-dependent DNA helicase subunit
MKDDSDKYVKLSKKDIARIDEICKNPPALTEYMLNALKDHKEK